MTLKELISFFPGSRFHLWQDNEILQLFIAMKLESLSMSLKESSYMSCLMPMLVNICSILGVEGEVGWGSKQGCLNHHGRPYT